MNPYYKKILLGLSINFSTSVLFSLTISLISIILALKFNSQGEDFSMLLQNTIRVAIASISLLILIHYSNNRLSIKLSNSIKIKPIVFILIILAALIELIIGINSTEFKNSSEILAVAVSMSFTGIAEEIIYRVIAMNCYPNYSWLVIILQGIVFSFVGHGMFGDFGINLVLRLPLGIILGVIYKHTHNLWYGACLHSLYDFSVYAELF